MGTRRRIVFVALSALAVILFLAVVALFLFSSTEWGRDQSRQMALDRLRGMINGEIEIGRVEGSLLDEFRLIDVSIVDTAGRPFLRADTIASRYSLRSLLSKRVRLSDLKLVNAEIVLDRPPGEEWNFVGIFGSDDGGTEAPSAWGEWVELRDIRLVDSRLTMRTAWEPPPDLSPSEEREAIRAALAGETRDNVVEVPGGFQNVMNFRELNAAFGRVLVAHPDTVGIPIDVEQFSGIAEPFRPPAAHIRDLAGNFRLQGDTLFFRNVDARLPESRLKGEGFYAMEHADLLLELDGTPVAFDDLRWLQPALPEEGGGTFDVEMRLRPLSRHIIAHDLDLHVGESQLQGKIDLLLGDTVRVQDTDLQFARLDTRLLEGLAPNFSVPRHGRLTGSLELEGQRAELQLDADVTFDDDAGGSSRVLADGRIAAEDQIRFHGLRVQMRPLRLDLVRAFAPSVPLSGTMEGTANLTGTLQDRLQLESDLVLRDPQSGVSRVTAAGGLVFGETMRLDDLRLRLNPLQLDLIRPDLPDIPPGATASGPVRLDGALDGRLQIDGDLTITDPATGVSRVAANGGIIMGDAMQADNLSLRLDPLQLNLLRSAAPDLPRDATASGPVTLDGPLGGPLQIDGDLTIDDPATGISRVAARGGVDFRTELRLLDLALRFDPLQTELLRAAVPDFPLGGILAGSATVSGSPSSRLSFVADLEHIEAGERSHVTGGGDVAMGPNQRFDLNLHLNPLSLRTAGRFVPKAGLRGYASGDLSVEGTLENFRFDSDLLFGDGGLVDAVGRLNLAGPEVVYDVRMVVDHFNPSSLSDRSPITTSLVGTAHAEGRGFDPATMRASIRADFEGLEIREYEADEVHLQLEIDRGLATVAPSHIRTRAVEAEIEGTFGLVSGREGVLAYNVRVDSLNMFAPWIPAADTGVVMPRPAVREAAREASERAAQDRVVELLATGELSEPERDPLAVLILPRDSLAGSLQASGTIRGNIEQFDADGHAFVEDVIYKGNYVESGEIDFALVDVGLDDVDVTIDASFETLLVGGFAFNAATIDGTYRGGRYGAGDAQIAIKRDNASDVRLDSEFILSLEGSELRLTDLDVRLDTVRWSTTAPAAVFWGGDGVTVENLEVQSTDGARIFIDGDLPVDGPADLDLVVSELEIGQLANLLQDNRDASGLLSLDARVRGTMQDLRIDGEGTLRDASLEGERVPNVHAAFTYQDEELRADAEFISDSLQIATAEARIPISLAFGDGGPRLLDRPMQIDIRADQLPLNVIPAFTQQVDDLSGSIAADVSITGTPFNPSLEGDLSMDLESLEFAPLGIRLEPFIGHASLEGSVLRIDSLLAYSDGPLRISGEVQLETLTNPVFNLEVEARDAWVIDTNDARLQVDADLRIEGPLESIEISGLVRTRRGVIYVPEMSEFGAADVVNLDDPATIGRLDSLLLAQRRLVMDTSPAFENVSADILVEIDRDVWLRSTEANVEIYTPSDVGPLRLEMRGLQRLPVIEGTINTDRGEYEYLSRRFTLTRGSVSFLGTEEIDPMLQLAAEHEVRIPGREALTIRIIVGGTLRNLEITLESNSQPPIPQTDLLSFLAFGREASTLIQGHGSSISGQASGGGGLVGNVAGIATQQFTAIALESMLSGLEADIGRELGLDVIRITPAHLSADVFTGSYLDVLRGTEIEAGRYVSSRLFVAAQARPARVFPGVRFEYRTRRDFEWSASWRSRFIPQEPSLRVSKPISVGVLGSFLFKEWRF